jgi:hypothetical protein
MGAMGRPKDIVVIEGAPGQLDRAENRHTVTVKLHPVMKRNEMQQKSGLFGFRSRAILPHLSQFSVVIFIECPISVPHRLLCERQRQGDASE